MSRPSIKDVAKKAGVGVGSVSRYLNTPEKVSEKMRRKVEAAIKELGYTPNEIARNLKTKNPRNVALLLPSIWHSFFSGLAYYVEAYLEEAGYKLMLCNSDGHPEKELYYLNMLKEKKVSGIITISYSELDDYINSSLPIISFDRHFKDDVSCITSDNYGGGELAAQELIRTGCKTLAYVGTYNTRIDTEVKYRKEGFKDYAEKHNVPVYLYLEEDPIRDYQVFLKGFFDRYRGVVDGVFVENDNLAKKLIMMAQEEGIKIPDELSVIGYDGVEDEFFRPKLSTIVQPLDLLAKTTVSKLIPIIEKKNKTVERIVVPVTFRKGETTRP